MDQHTITIGRVSIRTLQDIRQPARPNLMFPMSSAEALEPFQSFINERGHFAVNIGSFAVRTPERLILVDTGIGDKNRASYRNGHLPEALAEAGIKPEDVDIVLFTHLHIDHVGWNTVDRGAGWEPFFPRARYAIARREWEYWTQPEVAAGTDCIRDCVLPLDPARVDLMDDVTTVTPELTTVPTPGHTPGHVSIAIVSNGERGLITGDVVHHPVQMTEPDWNMTDSDREQATVTRKALIARVIREREIVIGTHFPLPSFGRMVERNGRHFWEPLLPLQQ